MTVKGIKSMTITQVQDEVACGGRFVQYRYCFSLIVMTYKQPSAVYFIKAGESAFLKSLPFTLVTILFGWWGIPWGVIYTLDCLFTNIGGGKDVTGETMKSLYKQTNGYVFEFEKTKALAF